MAVRHACLLLCAAGLSAGAAPPPFAGAGLTRLATVGRVTPVDGAVFVLPDGRRGRLAGILAPRLAPPGARFKSEPLAAEAKAAFARLAAAGRIAVWAYAPPRRVDRYDRLVVHLWAEPGGWVQGRLLALGLARVRTQPGDRALARQMLALEAEARRAKRGLWAHPYYRVRTDTEVEPGGFRIVEGRIVTVAERSRRAYLNFGRYWRRDFTVVLGPTARRLFRAAGIDLSGLARQRVRVRGWVSERGGPMIEVTHPEQIERLPPTPPARRPR